MNSNNEFYNPYPNINNEEDNIRNRYNNPTNHQVSEQDFNTDNTQQAIARDLLNNVEKKASSWLDKCTCNLSYNTNNKDSSKNILI
jgi:hypothetical protein